MRIFVSTIRRLSASRLLALALVLTLLQMGAAHAQQRQQPPARPQTPPTQTPGPGAKIEFMDLENMDINAILKVLSDSSDLNIIPSKDVTGKLSVYLKSITVDEAIDKIAKVNGLRFIREGNTVSVMTEEQYEQRVAPVSEQRVYPLKFARASQVAPLLQGALSQKGRVTPDIANNQLIVFDIASRLLPIESLIASLDQKEETRVVVLQHARAPDLALSLLPFLRDPRDLKIDERTNRLIVTDTPYQLTRLEGIITQLDLEDLTETRTYTLKYADAQRVADLLIEVLTGQRSDQQGRGALGTSSRRSNQQDQPRPIAATVTGPAPRIPREESRSTIPTSSSRSEQSLTQPFRSTTAPPAPAQPGAPGTVTAAGAAPSIPGAPGAETAGEARALGMQGTISADPRTNTVIVTHTPATLTRIETIIKALDVEMPLHVFSFEHADLEALALQDKLAQLLPGPTEDFQIDIASRKATFRTQPERAEHILALFKEWDQEVPQVYIEARVLRVALDLMRNLGATIRLRDKGPNGKTNSALDLLFPAAVGASPLGQVQFGDLTASQYTIIIQALETDSRSKLLSNPRVAVRDRKEATFQVATDQPFTEVVTDGSSNTTRQNTRFIPVGVTLTVAPQISKEGLVQMDVRVEVSSLVSINAQGVPVVDRSEAKSSVLVQDGHTLGIGGLILDEKMQTVNKVPWLGDIPVLKYLFRNKSAENKQSELLLFITPRLTPAGIPDTPPDQLVIGPSKIQLPPYDRQPPAPQP